MAESVGQLYGGLAQGIFGRLREHAQEQEKADFEQKGQALKYLSSLVDEATPETRPIVLKQMADVMGLKAKHRGVWDMLTGKGAQDYHDQLAGMIGGFSDNVVGQQEYDRRKLDLPMPGATGLDPVRPGKPDERTGREVVLRDPDQVALDKVRTQYGLQHQIKMDELDRRDALQARREYDNDFREAKLRQDTAARGAELNAQGDIITRAYAIAGQTGKRQPDDADYVRAAEEVAMAMAARDAAMRAMGPLRQAQTQQALSFAKLNEAQAAMDPATGLAVGRPMTQGQQATLSRQLTQDAIAVKTKWDAAYAKQKELELRERQLRRQLSNINPITGSPGTGEFAFDEAGGRFMRKDGTSPTVLGAETKKMLEELRKISAEKQAAIIEMEGLRATLGSQYGDQYDTADQWQIRPREGYRPAGVTNTTPIGGPPPFPAQAGVGGQSDFQYQSSKPVANGTVIPIKGERYRVIGIARKEGDRIVYNLEKVQ